MTPGERWGGQGFHAAGRWAFSEPGPSGLVYETDAAVWLPLDRARGVRCFAFEAGRTAIGTTVTTSGKPPKGRGRPVASFDLEAWVVDGSGGEQTDARRDRRDPRRAPVFTCSVANPGTTAGRVAAGAGVGR